MRKPLPMPAVGSVTNEELLEIKRQREQNPTERSDFIENNLMILSKQTMDLFLKQDNPGELISLYMFYYYTAKWQETNQPKATTGYAAQGLNWTESRVRKSKKDLIQIGLIEDVRKTNEKGQVSGYYIKIKYLWKSETIQGLLEEKPVLQKPSLTENHGLDNQGTNALSVNNLNALSVGNKKKLNNGFQLLIDEYCKGYENHFKLKPFLSEVTGKINVPVKQVMALKRIAQKYGLEKAIGWFKVDSDGETPFFMDERILTDTWCQKNCFYPCALESAIEKIKFDNVTGGQK